MIPDNINVRKTVIRFLTELADVDHFTHQFEWQYILNIGDDFGLSEADVIRIRNAPDFHYVLPDTEQGSMNVLYRLLFMSKYDRKVSDSEVDFIQKIGLKLGIRGDLSKELIEVMQAHIGKVVPREVPLEIIRKYLN
jgi:hypothetical protein